MSPTDYCLYSTKLFFTLTCTEKPLKFNSNKFFSIYNYLFRFIVSLFGFQWALCELFVRWWRWWDSNPWPPACRAGALPAELHPQNYWEFAVSPFCAFALVGPSGLEPPTSCLSGTRSNLLSYDPMWLGFSVDLTLGLSVVGTVLSVPITDVSIELSSRTVARKVFSPLQSLTSVFGMGTGGPSAFVTPTFSLKKSYSLKIEQQSIRIFISRQS